jgi:hypothetical protein
VGVKRIKGVGVWGSKKVEKVISLTPEIWELIDADLSEYQGSFSRSNWFECLLRRVFSEKVDLIPELELLFQLPTSSVVEPEPIIDQKEAIESLPDQIELDYWSGKIFGMEHLSDEETRSLMLEKNPKSLELYDKEVAFAASNIQVDDDAEPDHRIYLEDNQDAIAEAHHWLHANKLPVLFHAKSRTNWVHYNDGHVPTHQLTYHKMPLIDVEALGDPSRLGKAFQDLPIAAFSLNPETQKEFKAADLRLSKFQRLAALEYRSRKIVERVNHAVAIPPEWIDGEIGYQGSVKEDQLVFWAIAELFLWDGLESIFRDSVRNARKIPKKKPIFQVKKVLAMR